MRKSWLVCVFMGTLAWGQAQPAAPAAQSMPAAAPKEATPEEVPMSAAVITIKGVSCPEFSHAASTTAAAKTGAAAGKTGATAAKKPTDCVITRGEFEKLTKALQQGPTPLNAQQKRTLANQLPSAIAMSEMAKKKGIDKTEGYTETLKFVKMRILAQKMQDSVREDADKVPDAKIEKYYKDNPEAYEQFSLDRLFVPKNKQPSAEEKEEAKKDEAKDKDEKLTDEQQKAKEAADKAKQEKGEKEMTELAESLRQRAVAGEDFVKLQKDAFEAAGTKVENPTVNLPKVRRTGLPPAHAAVFELKVGEVSAVISDNGGHYIYKVVTKEVLPLDQVKEEIHNKLKGEQLKEMMDKYTNSYQAVTNEVYFGPAPPPGPARRPRMTPPGAPQGAAQPATPPAPAPAPQAPAKPN
jgi:hypothetical protein